MHTSRTNFAPTAVKAALAFGALSALTLAPHIAFAGGLPITVIGSFSNATGTNPYSGLAFDQFGYLFGTTVNGGAHGDGTVYGVGQGSTPPFVLNSFSGASQTFTPGVTLDSAENLYGATFNGGANGDGMVYKINYGTLTINTYASFNGANGANPQAGVVFDSSGNLFGTTDMGGANGDGVVYEIAKGSATITDLASFNGTDGANPRTIVLDSGGNIFGTTAFGGANGDGTVYEIAKGATTITDIASFNGTNGTTPQSGVILDSFGDLFGATKSGGASNNGTVYEVAKGSTTITDIAAFNGTNGDTPRGVVLDRSGNLFGNTEYGGANSDGAVFEIAKGSGAITDLASFNGTNGADPLANVVLDSSGNLFGVTNIGGANNGGTVYEIANADSGPSPAPEPSQATTLGLVLTGLTALLLQARKRKGADLAQATAEAE